MLDELTKEGCAALPFDQEWLLGMSLLAETSALLGDAASAAVLYDLLTPWPAYNAADPAEGIRGSVSRYLGLLATTTKRWAEAEKHFKDALTMNRRMGALPWLAQTQKDYAHMLLVRGEADDRLLAEKLLDEALAACREIGMESHAAETVRTR